MINLNCIGIFDYTEEGTRMKKDKFLTALLMTSCLLSVSMMASTPAQAAYTMDQEAEISLWTDYIKDYANDAFGYLNRANINYDAGEYTKAVADYDAVLKIDQYNTDAYVKRANAKFILNDLEGALKDYAIALEINPSLPEARFNIGRIFYKTQNFPKAVENMRAAIKLDAEKPEYQFELARSEYKAGMYAEAQQDFAKAISLKDNYLDAYYGKGLASMNLADFNDAIVCFETIIKSGQKYENAYYYKGLAEYQLGKYDLAIADFDIAIQETPEDGLLYNFRGKAKELLGNKSAAKKDYKMAKQLGITTVGLTAAEKSTEKVAKETGKVTPKVQTEPAQAITPAAVASAETQQAEETPITPEEKVILDEEVNKRLAGEKIAEGDIYSAVALYDNVVNVDPANSTNYLERAGLKLKVNDFDGAIRDAEMALKMDCDKGVAYFYQGKAYEGKNNAPFAYRAYALALRENPENPEYRYRFANMAFNVSRFSEAEEILSLVLDSNAADFPEAYLTRAKTRYQMGEFYSAIADSNKYIATNPKSAEAYFYSAMAKSALKNYEEALKDFNMAIKFDKDNTNYYLFRARANLALEDYKKVASDYKKIVDIKKDSATTEDHLRVAQAEVLNDNDEEALLYYDIIIANDKLNDNVYLDRARLFEKMGRHYDSINDYTTVLNLNPNQKVVYKERGLIFVDTKSYRKGILDLNEALKLEPKNGQLYYYRALAKQATGDKDGAMVDFDMAKRYDAL